MKAIVLEKLLGMRLNELMDISHWSKNLFKIQAFNDDKEKILLDKSEINLSFTTFDGCCK